jgi:hypothetical protein
MPRNSPAVSRPCVFTTCACTSLAWIGSGNFSGSSPTCGSEMSTVVCHSTLSPAGRCTRMLTSALPRKSKTGTAARSSASLSSAETSASGPVIIAPRRATSASAARASSEVCTIPRRRSSSYRVVLKSAGIS